MEQALIGLTLLAVELLAIWLIKKSEKVIRELKNSHQLMHIKHESFVEAYGYFEKNGMLKKYDELIEKKIKDQQFIRTT